MRLSSDTLLVRDQDASEVTIENKVVVLGIDAGAYFDFNPIGTEIWEMLAKPRRFGQLLNLIVQVYDDDKDIISRDVTNFLQMLINHNLVRVLASGST